MDNSRLHRLEATLPPHVDPCSERGAFALHGLRNLLARMTEGADVEVAIVGPQVLVTARGGDDVARFMDDLGVRLAKALAKQGKLWAAAPATEE